MVKKAPLAHLCNATLQMIMLNDLPATKDLALRWTWSFGALLFKFCLWRRKCAESFFDASVPLLLSVRKAWRAQDVHDENVRNSQV